MNMMIDEIIGLAERVSERKSLLSSDEKKLLGGIFDEYLTAIDGELSMRLGGVSMSEMDPHYVDYRNRVSADIKLILEQTPKGHDALQWLRQDLVRLDNHLSQASESAM